MSNITTFSFNEKNLSIIPPRDPDGHKGTFGRVLVIAGSHGMSGAAYFAAKAAYRSGAGLVELFTEETNRNILQAQLPEAVMSTYTASSPKALKLSNAMERADSVVIGCGLGTSSAAQKIVAYTVNNCLKPLIVDADALNIIAANPAILAAVRKRIPGTTVFTPHIGEMKRLIGNSDAEITSVPETAREFASKNGVVCALKCSETAVSNGYDRVYVNRSGNCGMATGGSGDVLAGIVGSLFAQFAKSKLTAMEKTCLAVYIHGLAGDAAARRLSCTSCMASDIIESLPEVFLKAESIAKQPFELKS